jgi:flagellar biosynthesis GTPase FlhF
VKVKALEAAEAAKRQEEQRMEERQARKKAMEFAKKAKERTIQEKMKEEQALLKKEIQEKSKAAEILRQKGVSVGTVKTLFTDTSSKFNSNNHGTLSKVNLRLYCNCSLFIAIEMVLAQNLHCCLEEVTTNYILPWFLSRKQI